MDPYRWDEPPPAQPTTTPYLITYRSNAARVYLSRQIVRRHTEFRPRLDPCVMCFDPSGEERMVCPLLRDALRVLINWGQAPARVEDRPARHWRDPNAPAPDWHPAQQL